MVVDDYTHYRDSFRQYSRTDAGPDEHVGVELQYGFRQQFSLVRLRQFDRKLVATIIASTRPNPQYRQPFRSSSQI